ncbi:MAG: tripartite tricarboxylate transporter substrate binding protein [Polaromonas sp.]|uniref:tripartite tricarboxylate transporter substrate binding protein n=1 Tax=Polaromonas sp. TaxID=1869339 RepID=UPI0025FB5066|nr:tripartite tricarboxylate transporter substrate binding protein [Polaromonas sp.]MBI2726520.1 tripartite tricarboxylate transporter substrate binding protein [Polaromonas sp.]
MRTPYKTLLVALFTLTVWGTTYAQSAGTFPVKAVTLVVPYTPSSGSDIIARIIAPKLSLRWGQAVVVDNKPGASGNIGAQQVASAPADGHTLLMAISTFTMAPAIYKRMPFDTVKDFAPITKLAESGFVFAINPSVPAKDMASLIAYAKQRNGALNYGTPGNGTPQHLAMELFKSSAGVNVVHVPYKGIQGALTDLMGGQVQMMFASVHSMRPHAEAGKVRVLAVTGSTRSALSPEVPTFREQGVNYMDSIDSWYAVLAPGRTPPDLIARLNKDFIEVINSDDVKAALMKQGLSIHTSTPLQLSQLIQNDLARWKKVVTDARIEAD